MDDGEKNVSESEAEQFFSGCLAAIATLLSDLEGIFFQFMKSVFYILLWPQHVAEG